MDETAAAIDIDFDIMEVCCACLSKNPSHWLINKTADAYTNITGIELTDDLPNQMCDSCSKILKQSDDFRTKCLESYEWLIEVKNQINNKTFKKELNKGTNTQNANYSYDITIKQESIEEEVVQVPSGIGQLTIVKTESLSIDNNLESIKLQQITKKKKENIPKKNILDKSNFGKVNKKINALKNPRMTKVNNIITTANHADYEENADKDIGLKEKQYKCDLCNYKTTEEMTFVVHKKTHVNNLYNCDMCEYGSSHKSNLVDHLRIHSREMPYKCDTCYHRFTQRSNLITHIRKHTGNKYKPYKCDTCHKSFTQKRALVEHIKRHSGEKPYKCDKCNYSATQNGHLIRHFRTHTGEKPYLCDICNRTFKKNRSLVQHLNMHAGIKSTCKCDICEKSFTRRDSLIKHIRKHTGETPYECTTCHERFRVKETLDYHIKKNKCIL